MYLYFLTHVCSYRCLEISFLLGFGLIVVSIKYIIEVKLIYRLVIIDLVNRTCFFSLNAPIQYMYLLT